MTRDGPLDLSPALTADEAGDLIRASREAKGAAERAEALATKALMRLVGHYGGAQEHAPSARAFAAAPVAAEVERALALVRAGVARLARDGGGVPGELEEAAVALERLAAALGGEP